MITIDEAIKVLKDNDYVVYKNTLNEGIDFDLETKMVSYNPSHQNNVDTSINNNPTVDISSIENVPVWSIFRRKKGTGPDGNPLIYALKGENDWIFKSDYDKKNVLKQFKLISDKFINEHSFDITIIVPSTNQLNNYIADTIQSKTNVELITGLVCKLTTEEVDDIVQEFGSNFRNHYGKRYNTAYLELRKYLDHMDELKNGTFCRHFIKNNEMRNVLDFTLKLSDDAYAKYANKINNREVLIIDDVVSRGETIKEMVNIIKTSYSPKSITVLTLLSKLYDN